MGAKIKTSARLFDVLSSGIYTDPILAPIRELSCNAWDAHVAAGCTDRPFEITVPTWHEPSFAVEDFGTGIPPEQFSDIFYTYGASTKTDSDEMIGALGLGSKSPFAYTKSSYTVRNRFNGTEYSYFCFINEDGEPDGSLVSESPTQEPNGVQVKFGVKSHDIYVFATRIKNFYRYWQGTMPLFKGENLKIDQAKNNTALTGPDWYLENAVGINYATAMMGNVPYKISAMSIPNLSKELEKIALNPFVITVPMGALDFTASREGLKYNESTSTRLIQELELVRKDIQRSFMQSIQLAKNKVEFVQQFHKIYDQFRQSFSKTSTDDTMACAILLGKKPSESITFENHEFNIQELIESKITIKQDFHQSFELISTGTRGKLSRIWANPITRLFFTAIENISAVQLYGPQKDDQLLKRGFSKDDQTTLTWRDKNPLRKSKDADYIINSPLFTVMTLNSVQINSKPTVFVVNDVGNSGEARFKLLDRQSNYIFVNFNHKISSVATVCKELESIVDRFLSGSDIKMISALPDNRLPVVKEKPKQGTMKLVFLSCNIGKGTLTLRNLNGEQLLFATNAKINTQYSKVEKIVNVSDLLAQKTVYYVVKRRSNKIFFEDVNSLSESVMKQEGLIGLASHYGVFKDSINAANVLEILVINESQVAALKKLNVNLQPIKKSIAAKAIELEGTNKCIEQLTNVAEYSGISILQKLADALGSHKIENLKEQDSLLAEQLLKFDKNQKVINSKQFIELQAIAYMHAASTGKRSIINVVDNQDKIKNKINKKYPLLKHLNIGLESIKEVMDYVKSIDE